MKNDEPTRAPILADVTESLGPLAARLVARSVAVGLAPGGGPVLVRPDSVLVGPDEQDRPPDDGRLENRSGGAVGSDQEGKAHAREPPASAVPGVPARTLAPGSFWPISP